MGDRMAPWPRCGITRSGLTHTYHRSRSRRLTAPTGTDALVHQSDNAHHVERVSLGP